MSFCVASEEEKKACLDPDCWCKDPALSALGSGSDGKKNDQNKTRWDLMPFEALEQVAQVMTFGAKKYADRGWEPGMAWGRLIGAAFRHLTAFVRGENLDPETKLPHLAHAACCVLFLLTYQLRGTPGDDRAVSTKGE